jgi:hypothetical protein
LLILWTIAVLIGLAIVGGLMAPLATDDDDVIRFGRRLAVTGTGVYAAYVTCLSVAAAALHLAETYAA